MQKSMAFSINEDLLSKLEFLSKSTMIPKSRLVEKAIIDFLEQYEEVKQILNNLPKKAVNNETK